MKKQLLSIALALTAMVRAEDDKIIRSSTTKVVAVETADEWRVITFTLAPETGEVTVQAIYETVVRENGYVKSRNIIRDVSLPWSKATNIAPALTLVRKQFNDALPTILAQP